MASQKQKEKQEIEFYLCLTALSLLLKAHLCSFFVNINIFKIVAQRQRSLGPKTMNYVDKLYTLYHYFSTLFNTTSTRMKKVYDEMFSL